MEISIEHGYLSEIYSAIQGEGTLVGVRQIFVRFSACDLRCVWCDTPESLLRTDFCELEILAGSRTFEKIKNPLSKDKLITYIQRLQPELHHSISLTGGEPLLQSDFLLNFLPQFKKYVHLPVYLESGGHRDEDLGKIINFIDYISMDFKLPSSAKTANLWENHLRFLNTALNSKSLKNIYVKIVITKDTLFDELEYSVNLIKGFQKIKNIDVVLQPVSEVNGSKPPSEKDLLETHFKLLKLYPYIKVIPQVHKLIGQR